MSPRARVLRIALSVLGASFPFLLWGLTRWVELPRLSLLQLEPAVLSLLACLRFAQTLRPGAVPQIEQFARALETEELPGFMLVWLRQVTIAWCVFLGANTLACLLLVLLAPLRIWALWTGAGFYASMGALLVGEYVVRKLRYRWYRDGALDRIWARAFPPRERER